jgi:hypothetical protein
MCRDNFVPKSNIFKPFFICTKHLLPCMDTAKSKYRLLAQKVSLPLQMQPWWWDALCGEDWKVLLVEENNGDLLAALPYSTFKKGPFKVMQSPPFTTYCGPWLKYPTDKNLKSAATIAFEKKTLGSLAENLPKTHFTSLHLSPDITNWLPFYWAGYSQTTRYTYRLDLNREEETIFANLKQSLRTDLRKSDLAYFLETSNDVSHFYPLVKHSYENQGQNIPYQFITLNKLFKACSNNKAGKLILAKDKQDGKALAGLFLAWDDRVVHAIASGQKDKSGPWMQHLFWQAISEHIGKKETFDFEGSMHETIEHFLRGFGGEMVPYHRIYKSQNLFFEILGKMLGKWS